jgi:glycosyltransferase involved in cell wall biosynthesis
VNWSRACAAVIPCWNEAGTLGDLLHHARPHLPAVWVVDDGSTDATADVAAAAGARVLRHPANRGKGAALRTGLTAAREAGFEWALTLDGDGQHAPACIPAFFRCASEEAAALVIGNRFAAAAPMPPVRRFVNRWMSRRLSRTAGHDFADSQCGMRLLRLDLWARLALVTDHFETESELLLAFARAGARIRFVPIPCLPAPRASRIRPLADTVRWFRWWLRPAPRSAGPPDTVTQPVLH